jgi:hypothetical protein
MGRIKFAKLKDDDKGLVVAAVVVPTLLFSVSSILSTFKLLTSWDAPWIWVLAPVWIPLMIVVCFLPFLVASRHFVDFSEESSG